jgi:prevent-host-death family protein
MAAGHGRGLLAHRLDLYDSYMTEIAVSEAREHLSELIESTHRTGEPVYVTRRGRPVAVILDPEQFERIIENFEAAADREALRQARADDDYVPWDEVKAELGLA